MNAPAKTPVADRIRQRALWSIESELRALAQDVNAIASLGDEASDVALAAFDKALERVRDRARALVTREVAWTG